jgi:hypothetical protein
MPVGLVTVTGEGNTTVVEKAGTAAPIAETVSVSPGVKLNVPVKPAYEPSGAGENAIGLGLPPVIVIVPAETFVGVIEPPSGISQRKTLQGPAVRRLHGGLVVS